MNQVCSRHWSRRGNSTLTRCAQPVPRLVFGAKLNENMRICGTDPPPMGNLIGGWASLSCRSYRAWFVFLLHFYKHGAPLELQLPPGRRGAGEWRRARPTPPPTRSAPLSIAPPLSPPGNFALQRQRRDTFIAHDAPGQTPSPSGAACSELRSFDGVNKGFLIWIIMSRQPLSDYVWAIEMESPAAIIKNPYAPLRTARYRSHSVSANVIC